MSLGHSSLRALPIFAAVVLILTSLSPVAAPHANADEARVAPARDMPYLRLGLDLATTSRSFTAQGAPGEETGFESPLRVGMNLRLQLFPLAALLQDRGPLDGFGFYLDSGRVKLTTQVLVEDEDNDGAFVVTVPTRQATMRLGAIYDVPVHDQVRLHLSVGYTSLSYTLGYNRVLSSNFYKGVELGAGTTIATSSGIEVTIGALYMPSVSMGSAEEYWGTMRSGYSITGEGVLRWMVWAGFFLEGRAEFSVFNSEFTYESSDGEPAPLSLNDQFLTFSLGLGYAFGRPTSQ